MLSKLLAEGLIKEMDNGRYSATKKGIDILADIESARNILQGQIDILPRICKVVKSATDRLFTRGSVLSLVLDKMQNSYQTNCQLFETNVPRLERYIAEAPRLLLT
jgi:predicted transcriptional regulator